MAMTPKEAIARIKRNQINQVTAALKQNQATRNAFAIEPAKFKEAPTVQEVLSDLKANLELKILQQEDEERNKYNMTEIEYKRMKSNLVSERNRSLRGVAEIAEKKKATMIANAEELDSLKKQQENKIKIEDQIQRGEGPLPTIIRNEIPKLQSTVNNYADINFVSLENAAGMQLKDSKHFFTPNDIEYLAQKGKFREAGISDDELVKILQIDMQSGNAEYSIENAQKLLFKYLNSPAGRALATGYKINLRDEESQDAVEQLLEIMRLEKIRQVRGLGNMNTGTTQADSTRVATPQVFNMNNN
tara:strand:+ start:300 stop:1208 length:909 start_codon:yes stop_codon:yes gene_type:complete